MCEIEKEVVYGTTVYKILTEKKIPYQLTFERDLFYDRINVCLIPMLSPEKVSCPDLRNAVIKSFLDYFNDNPQETVYIDIDIYHSRNQITLYKFLKWMEPHIDSFDITVDLTMSNSILYVEIYIKNK